MPSLANVLLVDSDAVAKAITILTAAAAHGTVSQVDSAVQHCGATPWGDDAGLGQAFGSVFAQPRQALVQTIQILPEVVQDLADMLNRALVTFGDVEDCAVEAVQRGAEQPSWRHAGRD
ncbi:hypothetical protein [Dactylosporangium darangshiense]|uniref:Uncharacterized protein n=1 Tax=Dactylosporangium darangshiense TaxID=579108 RepID=A0ABP8DUQ8_9ACTN